MATLLYVLELFFLLLLGIQVIYLFFFSVASIFSYQPLKKEQPNITFHQNKITVIIPGYKEDRIIIDTARKALLQSYPHEFYKVIIAADSFKPSTLEGLRQLDVRVEEVHFENSTKAKSINRILDLISDYAPDIVVILDSDNIMARDFLEQINRSFNQGFDVVQGHRTAKNQNTSFALLDAINEEIGNSIFRKGHRVLGFSSALIGSAMAFDYKLYRDIMSDIEDVAGEDKLVELKLLKNRRLIEYLPKADVYDEKVSSAQNFSKQRTRWVGVQLYFLKNYFSDGVKELFLRGNFNYFDKTFQMFLVPKVLLIGIMGILGILSLLLPLNPLWLYLAIIYYLALLLAVPRRFYNIKLLKALANIPVAIVFMMLSILRIRKSTASKFEVTDKSVTSEE